MANHDEKCLQMCRKHPCPDCIFCQHCSETRCNACRGKKKKVHKMTQAEQIQLFEDLNQDNRQAPELPVYYKKTSPS